MKLIPQWLHRSFDGAVAPLANRLIASGVHPNTLTTIGLLIVMGSAVAFALGHASTGAFVLLLSGLFDALDGKVARGAGKKTAFGAFYDSTLDRIGEAMLFSGITVYFVIGKTIPESWVMYAVMASLTALAGSLIVSYTRARAEGLNLECKVGLIQRAERIVGLGAPILFFGDYGGWLLFVIVSIIAVLSMLTVLQRIMHVYRLTKQQETTPERAAPEPEPVPALVNEEK